MSLHPDRVRWNRHYSDPRFVPDWAPDVALVRHLPHLPRGRALDLASGVGANALFLARRGYEVEAVDLSDVALERLRRAAVAEGLAGIALRQAALADLSPEEGGYDLILCVRCVREADLPRLADALRPGGVLFCHTTRTGAGDQTPEGWPRCFPGLEVLAHDVGVAEVTYLGRRPRV